MSRSLRVGGSGLEENLVANSLNTMECSGSIKYNLVARTISQRYYKDGSENLIQTVQPVLTPDRVKKCQNGRIMKEDGEEMFTLTGQDVHGVAILSHPPRTNDPKLGGSGPLISDEHCFTVDSTPHMVIEKDEHDIAIYNHPRNIDRKYFYHENEVLSALRTVQRPPSKALEKSKLKPLLNPNMRIRRLTPGECEKLMNFPSGWTKYGYQKGATLTHENVYGWKPYTDEDGVTEDRWVVVGKKPLERPLEDTVLISDTQRYKLCGNSVVTSIITFIGKRLLEMMNE